MSDTAAFALVCGTVLAVVGFVCLGFGELEMGAGVGVLGVVLVIVGLNLPRISR